MSVIAATESRAAEQRHQPRMKVPAMYTLLRARPAGEERYRWTGHIYDVSLSGMRFELDQPVEAGTRIEFRAMLPGRGQVMVRGEGVIVRLQGDDPRVGPVRLAMRFERFASTIDSRRLGEYLDMRLLAASPARRAA